MPQRHPDGETLARLVEGTLPEDVALKLGRHLFGCARCRGSVAATAEGRWLILRLLSLLPAHDGDPPPAYDSVISRTYQTLVHREAELQQERARAPALLAELRRYPAARQRVLVANVERFQTWGLAELILVGSDKAFFEDPAEAEGLALLALEVAAQLDPAVHSEALLADLRARCWSHVGNARRIGSDLPGAEEAFARAEAHLGSGTEDPLERAGFLRMKASLLRDRRRLAEAEALFEKAVAIYRRVGDAHLVGATLVSLSVLHASRADHARSIETLERAVELIDPERDPRLGVVTRTNLLLDLTAAGRFMEARALLVRSRDLFARHGEATIQLRYLWVQGRIAGGLGQHEQAEAALLRAREGFLARKIHYEAALVALELATLYLRQGRTAEVKRLAAETLPVFQTLDIQRETLAAFLVFRQAAERERATLQLVAEVRVRLERTAGQAPVPAAG